MSNVNSFSVFPPPRVPRIAVPSPHNRKPSMKTVKQLDSFKESVVIALEEMPATKISTGHPMPVLKNGIPPPPPLPQKSRSRSPPNQKGNGQNSKQGSPDPSSISSSETLVSSPRSNETVVPIRSMFPVYNPSVPLSQQTYPPQRPNAPYSQQQHKQDSLQYNSQMLHANSARASVISRTNQPSIVDVPLDTLNFKEPNYSSAKELEKLWDATSNMEQNVNVPSFDLELGRIEAATFVLGSSPGEPFYSITTYDTSEISITKTCPRKATLVCDVSLSAIEEPSRRLPPNDGLVSFIFPKMAAMLAINQTSALAQEYAMSPSDQEEIQEAAMKRAATQEASFLRWNEKNKRYELEHPAVTRRHRETNFVSSPTSPQGITKPVVHLTVITSDHVQDKPVILVTFPASLRSQVASAGPSSPRTPEEISDIHLASLDFNTNTLHLETNNVLELMPSLFAIDSIVSALVTVAVSDPYANVAMGNMDIWLPKPPKPNRASWAGSQTSTGFANGGAFYATIAEREEAEEEARIAAKNYRKSVKVKRKSMITKISELPAEEIDVEAGRTWYGKAKKPKKKKQIVIGEFDLEKLTHYQSGARQGQELPAITRGALSAMVSSLKFVVWFQTMIVQFLCWLLVAVTRGVTSEKF